MASLRQLLESRSRHLTIGSDGTLTVDGDFLSPGFLAPLAAHVKAAGYARGAVSFASPDVRGYISAIRFAGAVWGADDFAFDRRNAGVRYSPLVHLATPADTGTAASTINDCIRTILADAPPRYVDLLRHVVSEVHENVGAHAEACGFSCAQAHAQGDDQVFEFSIADCGKGFLRECQRIGLGVRDDREAIEWCIQRGHSTKAVRPVDEFAQYVPEDAPNVPIPGPVRRTPATSNNHAGLGLDLLLRLVRQFGGSLTLASGASFLAVSSRGRETYHRSPFPWPGVALTIQFRIATVLQRVAAVPEDPLLEEIYRRLQGIRVPE